MPVPQGSIVRHGELSRAVLHACKAGQPLHEVFFLLLPASAGLPAVPARGSLRMHAPAQAAADRMAAFQRNVDRCHARIQELRSYSEALFQGIFAHRFRRGGGRGWAGPPSKRIFALKRLLRATPPNPRRAQPVPALPRF